MARNYSLYVIALSRSILTSRARAACSQCNATSNLLPRRPSARPRPPGTFYGFDDIARTHGKT